MSDVRAIVLGALTPVLSNSWATELPPNPVWPAIVFDVDSAVEPGWATGGAPVYDQHEVTVTMMAKDLDTFVAQATAIRAAFEALEDYMFEEDSGDGEYEGDPEVYVRFITFRLRTRRD